MKSIAKKNEELRRAKAEMMGASRSEGKATMIRVRAGLLVGGVLLLAAEFVMAYAAQDANSHTVLGYLGALMLLAWVVILFAGMFLK